MTRGDRVERVSIVLGSAVILSLPMSALWMAFGLSQATPATLLWFVPGLIVGWLVATEKIDVTYRQVWVFSLTSFVLTIAGWVGFGIGYPPTDVQAATSVWAGAVGIAFVATRKFS